MGPRTAQGGFAAMHSPLRFRDDGTFTIVQFTDTHWHNGEPKDQETRLLMEEVLDVEQPDLVVLTGDVIGGAGCHDPAQSWRDCVAPIEERRIPWAAVFGNHDDEGALSREALLDAQRSCSMCLTERGPTDVSGIGNYVLRVRSASNATTPWTLYFMDSNSYAETAIGGYGWFRRDQIEWYLATASALRKENGGVVPALAFFHIPLPEYDEVWDHHPCVGYKYEAICCPRVNTGFFAALHEAGDVRGTFVGHDHINDFEGTLYGIRLCYGRGSGRNTYGKDGFPLGARVICIEESSGDFATWLCLEGGKRAFQQPLHEPRGRVLSDASPEAAALRR
jgi:3',5'-cyclic AMP phosphodiesterase CpdA